MIAAGLVVGLLVLAGCGSDKTSTPPPAGLGQGDVSLKTGGAGGLGGGSGSDSNVDHHREIAAMKVCPMVDLKPLATALEGTIHVGPDDIPVGYGFEPGGVACAGQIKGDMSAPTSVSFSAFNISTVGYSTLTETKTEFRRRVAENSGTKDAQAPIPLDGDWDEGSLVVAEGRSSSMAHALVRKGTWLVKVNIEVSASGKDPENLSAARESFRPVVTNLVKSVYDGVNSNLNG